MLTMEMMMMMVKVLFLPLFSLLRSPLLTHVLLWTQSIFMRVILRHGPLYCHGLTWIRAWISNYMPRKMRDEITYDK